MTGQDARVLVIGSATVEVDVFESMAVGRQLDVVPPGSILNRSGFDAVFLPGGLFDGARPFPAEEQFLPLTLLRQAHGALRPGGVVVGHFYHLASAHGLRQTVAGRISLTTWIRNRGLMSGSGCQRALESVGFTDAECYYVEPQITDPMVLVPLHRVAARTHFIRAIRRTRGQYSASGYGVRMALAACGMGGLLQPHLFFWARRAC